MNSERRPWYWIVPRKGLESTIQKVLAQAGLKASRTGLNLLSFAPLRIVRATRD